MPLPWVGESPREKSSGRSVESSALRRTASYCVLEFSDVPGPGVSPEPCHGLRDGDAVLSEFRREAVKEMGDEHIDVLAPLR